VCVYDNISSPIWRVGVLDWRIRHFRRLVFILSQAYISRGYIDTLNIARCRDVVYRLTDKGNAATDIETAFFTLCAARSSAVSESVRISEKRVAFGGSRCIRKSSSRQHLNASAKNSLIARREYPLATQGGRGGEAR